MSESSEAAHTPARASHHAGDLNADHSGEATHPASKDQPAAKEAQATSVSARNILALAWPALVVLAATPLYLLLDTAVVGRLGALPLAGLAAGSTLYSMVTTQLTFLSYGTTARSARAFGAGRRDEAIAEGVQATWLAIAVGLLLTVTMWLGAPAFTQWLSHDEGVAALATHWLRITSLGIPLVLCIMAGNGWLRGIQNTRLPLVFTLAGVIPGAVAVPLLVARLGLIGSAWANLIGVCITSTLFLLCLRRFHRGSWTPRPRVMFKQLVLGRDLIARSLSFQVAFLSAAAVASRYGAPVLAAHQILLQIWNFLALVLDSLAIAAQALTGAALGAGSVRIARLTGRRIVQYSFGFSVVLAAVFFLGRGVMPRWFTQATPVLDAMSDAWLMLIVLILLGGIVFALDGVLLGASDAAFLRTASIASVVLGFLPVVWISLWLHGGLVGVWWGILAFIGIRLVAVVWRFQSGAWATTSPGESE